MQTECDVNLLLKDSTKSKKLLKDKSELLEQSKSSLFGAEFTKDVADTLKSKKKMKMKELFKGYSYPHHYGQRHEIHHLDLVETNDLVMFSFSKLTKSWRKGKYPPQLSFKAYPDNSSLCVVQTLEEYMGAIHKVRGEYMGAIHMAIWGHMGAIHMENTWGPSINKKTQTFEEKYYDIFLYEAEHSMSVSMA